MSEIEIKSEMPLFGTNYKPGYSFGVYNSKSLISHGIAWFTRRDDLAGINCSHVGIVSDSGNALESLMRDGVTESSLDKYFNNPHLHIFFRKPRHWTPQIGEQISTGMRTLIGKPYDINLIKAHAMTGSFAGHFLNKLTSGDFEKWIEERFDTQDAYICSEACAWTMQQISCFAGLGCLTRPACTINPVQYITDSELWTPLQ
jgi:hypothetical protein